jgi:hypothetical protein
MQVTNTFFNELPNYQQYFELINNLFEQGKTTGDNQSEAMLNYSKLGISRTKRGLKTFQITEELLAAAKSLKATKWLVISEAWCGDAGNTTPIIAILADQLDNVDLRVILRDDNPEIMDNYLTNGGRAIPIMVFFDDELNEVFRWGPRPKPAQDMVMEHKNNPEETYEEFSIRLQKWYQQDKTQTTQQELTDLMKSHS